MNPVELRWRIHRLAKMSPSEVAWRLSDHARHRSWASQQVAPGAWPPADHPDSVPAPSSLRPTEQRTFRAVLRPQVLADVPEAARQRTVAAAEQLLAGRWEVLGTVRHDMEDPDWFLDPVTGRRAPQAQYCFRVDHRHETVTGNVKQLWELSRMHHVTVLSAAFAFTRDGRFADRAARHLRSWWDQNPFLSGVHWTNGIEAGLRLISWVWARRLLDGWPGAADLFEKNEVAANQVWWHQRYLASFRSRGSSANNHVIAEAAGQLVAALAFDWFTESRRWATSAAALLEDELAKNTFPSGTNREMAFDYHGFVAELGLVAAAEASYAGRPLGEQTWDLLCRMVDVAALSVDVALRAPRQGDGDDGRALVLGPPRAERWADLLAAGRAIFGAPPWWPACSPTVASTLLAAMNGRRSVPGRPDHRPSHLADAGLTILRTAPDVGPEIWCRCDAGPHGYLSIAAHAHADALSVEVRHDGTDVLADPGTYCYHGEEEWRRYFRSTIGHNTIEIATQDQSVSGGPFLWRRHARSHVLELVKGAEHQIRGWSAEHDGYAGLSPPVRHRRTVLLDDMRRTIEIVDRVETDGRHRLRMAFHLGPEVSVALAGNTAHLTWTGARSTGRATLDLPEELSWEMVRGATDPVMGWYSPRFGEKHPSWTLFGQGAAGNVTLRTALQFES